MNEDEENISGKLKNGPLSQNFMLEGLGSSIDDSGNLVKESVELDKLDLEEAGYVRVTAVRRHALHCNHIVEPSEVGGKCTRCKHIVCKQCFSQCSYCLRWFCVECLHHSFFGKKCTYCRSCAWKVLIRNLLGYKDK